MKITAADKWFSLCIRERSAWRCERCNRLHTPNGLTRSGLDCSHYETRDNWAVRFWPYNCFALCRGCHVYFDEEHRFEYEDFYLDKLGAQRLEEDRWLSHQSATLAKVVHHNERDIALHYRTQYRAMLVIRSQGVTDRLPFVEWPGFVTYLNVRGALNLEAPRDRAMEAV